MMDKLTERFVFVTDVFRNKTPQVSYGRKLVLRVKNYKNLDILIS